MASLGDFDLDLFGILGGSPLAWDQCKRARNHTNNEIKNAKRKYFTDNLESSKSNPKNPAN